MLDRGPIIAINLYSHKRHVSHNKSTNYTANSRIQQQTSNVNPSLKGLGFFVMVGTIRYGLILYDI